MCTHIAPIESNCAFLPCSISLAMIVLQALYLGSLSLLVQSRVRGDISCSSSSRRAEFVCECQPKSRQVRRKKLVVVS